MFAAAGPSPCLRDISGACEKQSPAPLLASFRHPSGPQVFSKLSVASFASCLEATLSEESPALPGASALARSRDLRPDLREMAEKPERAVRRGGWKRLRKPMVLFFYFSGDSLMMV